MARAEVVVSLDKSVAEYVEQIREALRGDVEALRAAGWVRRDEVLEALHAEARRFDDRHLPGVADGLDHAAKVVAERFTTPTCTQPKERS